MPLYEYHDGACMTMPMPMPCHGPQWEEVPRGLLWYEENIIATCARERGVKDLLLLLRLPSFKSLFSILSLDSLSLSPLENLPNRLVNFRSITVNSSWILRRSDSLACVPCRLKPESRCDFFKNFFFSSNFVWINAAIGHFVYIMWFITDM